MDRKFRINPPLANGLISKLIFQVIGKCKNYNLVELELYLQGMNKLPRDI